MNEKPRPIVLGESPVMMTEVATRAKRELMKSAGVPLDVPYFKVATNLDAMARGQCTHENLGVTLDKVNRTVTCNGCKLKVDPFNALLHYAASEQRLVYQREQEHRMAQRETHAKERSKRTRPFVRAVVNVEPVKDFTLKAEPVIGHTLTLECQHKVAVGVDGITKTRTCGQCAAAATTARAGTDWMR